MFDKYNEKRKRPQMNKQKKKVNHLLTIFIYIYIYINKYKVIRQQVSNYTQIDKRFNCDDDDDN